MKDEQVNARVTTPEFRVSFPAVFEPKMNTLNKKMEYSVVMLFDKQNKAVMDQLAKLYDVMEQVASLKFMGKIPANLRTPFRNLDVDRPEYYKGFIWVTARSTQRPGVVDQRLNIITPESSEFYAGCYARATIQFYAYDTMGNRGVSAGLQNIQKLRNGEKFSGRQDAELDFTTYEDESDKENMFSGVASTAATPSVALQQTPLNPIVKDSKRKLFG